MIFPDGCLGMELLVGGRKVSTRRGCSLPLLIRLLNSREPELPAFGVRGFRLRASKLRDSVPRKLPLLPVPSMPLRDLLLKLPREWPAPPGKLCEPCCTFPEELLWLDPLFLSLAVASSHDAKTTVMPARRDTNCNQWFRVIFHPLKPLRL